MQIAIIGAGNIGSSLAQNFVQKSFNVTLIDKLPKALNNAKDNIFQSIRLGNLFSKIKYDATEMIENIEFTCDIDKISSIDFVIESITESIKEKENLYRQINNISIKNKIVASNTSCIPITQIASWVDYPESIIGIHFMNPVPQIDTVEVIISQYTSTKTISKIENILNMLDKKFIIIKDFPGFISNRISHLMINEAAYIFQDQYVEAKQIDTIFKQCYGHKMGPLETADLIGLDTIENTLNLLYAYYNEDKFKCCPVISEMVSKGYYGKKVGKGFYNYLRSE
ncbi:3-hydroxyacyl-CoA dehydrogenase family protein [Faecalibacillus faecis]|jgi:3-hydroxyacyl-CoA dehydrogenase, NAD-binding|uniref:3-hydroxyacyl-CoA dehydrogenase family protein n=1 Tax=Faecalibacillus faecis TaxID=1982628 RepID=UPI003FD708AB